MCDIINNFVYFKRLKLKIYCCLEVLIKRFCGNNYIFFHSSSQYITISKIITGYLLLHKSVIIFYLISIAQLSSKVLLKLGNNRQSLLKNGHHKYQLN